MDAELQAMKYLKDRPELSSVCRVLHFHCYRKARDGSMQDLRVEIHDEGPGVSERYMAFAMTPDGSEACGNNAADIQMAIAGVHWQDLDKESGE